MNKSWLVTAVVALSPLSANATVWTVEISGMDFVPQHLTIAPGDSVKWHNADAVPHQVKSGTSYTFDGKFSTALLGGGVTSAAVVFNTSGEFFYYCSVHLSLMMHGNDYSIKVVPPPPTVSGKVILEQTVGIPAGWPITFTLYNGTTAVETQSTTLATDGSYSVTFTNTGGTHVGAKPPTHLSYRQAATLVSGTNTLNWDFLVDGDTNNDNSVDLLDLGNVLSNFSTTGPPGTPGDVDLDGQANLIDLGIVLSNFSQTGS
jgi:plastocyanin